MSGLHNETNTCKKSEEAQPRKHITPERRPQTVQTKFTQQTKQLTANKARILYSISNSEQT